MSFWLFGWYGKEMQLFLKSFWFLSLKFYWYCNSLNFLIKLEPTGRFNQKKSICVCFSHCDQSFITILCFFCPSTVKIMVEMSLMHVQFNQCLIKHALQMPLKFYTAYRKSCDGSCATWVSHKSKEVWGSFQSYSNNSHALL